MRFDRDPSKEHGMPSHVCLKCGKGFKNGRGFNGHVRHCEASPEKAIEAQKTEMKGWKLLVDPVALVDGLDASEIRKKIAILTAQTNALTQLLKVAEAREQANEWLNGVKNGVVKERQEVEAGPDNRLN